MSEPSNKPDHENATCPRCRQPGRAVSAVTVAAMLNPGTDRRLTSTAGFRFCPTQDCAVAYFDPTSDELVLQREVRVPIFQKSTDPHRLVCYCFGHTAGAVQSEIRAKASSSILEDIKSRCAHGLDACERNNPQGACCLGNVQRLIRQTGTSTVPPSSGSCCCCGGN
jgi:hypothetical protein